MWKNAVHKDIFINIYLEEHYYINDMGRLAWNFFLHFHIKKREGRDIPFQAKF